MRMALIFFPQVAAGGQRRRDLGREANSGTSAMRAKTTSNSTPAYIPSGVSTCKSVPRFRTFKSRDLDKKMTAVS